MTNYSRRVNDIRLEVMHSFPPLRFVTDLTFNIFITYCLLSALLANFYLLKDFNSYFQGKFGNQ